MFSQQFRNLMQIARSLESPRNSLILIPTSSGSECCRVENRVFGRIRVFWMFSRGLERGFTHTRHTGVGWRDGRGSRDAGCMILCACFDGAGVWGSFETFFIGFYCQWILFSFCRFPRAVHMDGHKWPCQSRFLTHVEVGVPNKRCQTANQDS